MGFSKSRSSKKGGLAFNLWDATCFPCCVAWIFPIIAVRNKCWYINIINQSKSIGALFSQFLYWDETYSAFWVSYMNSQRHHHMSWDCKSKQLASTPTTHTEGWENFSQYSHPSVLNMQHSARKDKCTLTHTSIHLKHDGLSTWFNYSISDKGTLWVCFIFCIVHTVCKHLLIYEKMYHDNSKVWGLYN